MSVSDHIAESILNDYETKHILFGELKSRCDYLLKDLLRHKDIAVHSVTSRVKEKRTLAEKLTREGRNYTCLADVTDIVGIRVITLFENEIDEVGHLVEKEFTIDPVNSVDKRRNLDPDRFGYLSLHYICSFSPERLRLAEYQSFENLKFEIQIRSILQHAWAEIEHDLGYKSGHGVPAVIRRRFSRVAGLLEMADEEFAAIRDKLQAYESQVKDEVSSAPARVSIDKVSLKALFAQNTVVREIDEELARGINATIKEENASILPILSNGLPSVGINTVEQLIAELEKHRELLLYQAVERFRDKGLKTLNRGVSVLQLLWIFMGLHGEEDGIMRGIAKMGLEGSQPNRQFAHEVMLRIKEFQSRSGGGRKRK